MDRVDIDAAADAVDVGTDHIHADTAPARNCAIRDSAAWVRASRRGSPRNPQVPLIVWTSRKMSSRIAVLLGSRSKRTSSRSTTSRFSPVSVRNSPNRSSMTTGAFDAKCDRALPRSRPRRGIEFGNCSQCVAKRFNFGCGKRSRGACACARNDAFPGVSLSLSRQPTSPYGTLWERCSAATPFPDRSDRDRL